MAGTATASRKISGGRGLALAGLPWADRLRALLRYAVLAPSCHNTQPWKVHIDDNVMELFLDHRRATPVVDPAHRELTISCGAFLFHLRTAAGHFGWDSDVTLFPQQGSAGMAARVAFSEHGSFDSQVERLFQAIPGRRTCRLPFEPGRLDADVAARFCAAAAAEGAQLLVLDDEPRRLALARLVAKADQTQWANLAFREELASWCYSGGPERRDGMPGVSLGQGDLMTAAAPLVVRTFDLGSTRAARDEELAHGSPLLAVLLTEHDEALDWLKAGQALDRVLLGAAAEGVSTSFFNQCIEVPAMRRRVTELLGTHSSPQIVLRMGRPAGSLPAPTPRRPIEEILL